VIFLLFQTNGEGKIGGRNVSRLEGSESDRWEVTSQRSRCARKCRGVDSGAMCGVSDGLFAGLIEAGGLEC